MRTVRVVGAAIVRDSEVLVARRGNTGSEAGKWEFPGGKVEPGETPEAALAREIDEELGVAIEVGAALGTGVVTRAELRIVLTVFEARLLAGEPEAREHAELRWLGLGALEALDWAEADLPAVANLARRHE